MGIALRAAAVAFLASFALAAGTNELSDVKRAKPVDTYPFAKGSIAKLDLPAKRITLKTERGLRGFDLTPRTYIFRGKEKLTPDKLKTGDNIKLNYYTNELGQAMIRRIKVDQPEPPQE